MISYPNSREGLQALVTVPENHRFKERYRSGGYVRRLEKIPGVMITNTEDPKIWNF